VLPCLRSEFSSFGRVQFKNRQSWKSWNGSTRPCLTLRRESAVSADDPASFLILLIYWLAFACLHRVLLARPEVALAATINSNCVPFLDCRRMHWSVRSICVCSLVETRLSARARAYRGGHRRSGCGRSDTLSRRWGQRHIRRRHQPSDVHSNKDLQ